MPSDLSFPQRVWQRIKYQVLAMEDRGREVVIGVGLPKTATTSLCDALEELGYRAIHYPSIFKFEGGQVGLRWPWWMAGYNAMADLPAAMLYRELADRFPNARFVLTLRNMETWLSSSQKHYSRENHEETVALGGLQGAVDLYCHMYGCPWFDRDRFAAAYQRHEREVREFFKGSRRFTTLDIEAGDGWQELAGFLAKEVPNRPFPRSNVWSSNHEER
jgi:hypothetical protein